MENEIEKIPILRLTEESRNSIDDLVAREFPLTVILNNQELVTLLCSPKDLRYLAIGFLFSEGLLGSKDEIKKIMVDDQRGIVRVETEEDDALANELVFKRFITSGCGRGASFYSAADVQDQAKVESRTQIPTHDVLSLVNDFQHRSQVYRATGGVHSAALCDTENILVFNEDIGRHNAIDKIFGECLLEDIATDGGIVITSGRISSEILLKVAKRNIPIIISKSAPTDLGVKLASDLGITLLGFVRGKRINVYTNDWRIA
ncbi:formate dehydrogenase accessory sulfurtransferase FdhD [Chloroflexota bacterium]